MIFSKKRRPLFGIMRQWSRSALFLKAHEADELPAAVAAAAEDVEALLFRHLGLAAALCLRRQRPRKPHRRHVAVGQNFLDVERVTQGVIGIGQYFLQHLALSLEGAFRKAV